MGITLNNKMRNTLDGQHRPSSVFLKWLWFFLSFFFVWLFMFIIAPSIEKTPAVKPIADFIEDTGIDASALYYTEVEEASEAELNMRHSMKYRPQGN